MAVFDKTESLYIYIWYYTVWAHTRISGQECVISHSIIIMIWYPSHVTNNSFNLKISHSSQFIYIFSMSSCTSRLWLHLNHQKHHDGSVHKLPKNKNSPTKKFHKFLIFENTPLSAVQLFCITLRIGKPCAVAHTPKGAATVRSCFQESGGKKNGLNHESPTAPRWHCRPGTWGPVPDVLVPSSCACAWHSWHA